MNSGNQEMGKAMKAGLMSGSYGICVLDSEGVRAIIAPAATDGLPVPSPKR